MKHVYPTNEIAHLWAHQTQPSARNPQHNFYFDGDTIYSYGSHFPIARHIKRRDGARAVLITTRTCSSTTAGHIWSVRHAIPSTVHIFHVPSVMSKPSVCLTHHADLIKDALKECYGPTGRFRPRAWAALESAVESANEFAEWFGYKRRWQMPASTDAIKDAIARDNARKLRAEATRWRAREQARIKEAAEQAIELEKWKRGESTRVWSFRAVPCALRVKDGEVETSQGASFPLSHAKRGLKFVRAVVASGVPYKTNGHTFHLGHYAIDSVDTDGTVRAGCHVVTLGEIERIAPEIEAAYAEQYASEHAWTVEWRDDELADASFVETWEPAEQDEWNAQEHECLEAILYDEGGEVLASCGGIFDPSRDYRRVMEAALFSEALESIEREERNAAECARLMAS